MVLIAHEQRPVDAAWMPLHSLFARAMLMLIVTIFTTLFVFGV